MSRVKHQTQVPQVEHIIKSKITSFSWQVETKLEREARGRPIGRDVPYAAMGGLTGFSSLLDGYLALEASGSGELHMCSQYVTI